VLWTINETAGSVAADELGRLLVAGERVTALSAASGGLLWQADVGGFPAVYPGSGGEILVSGGDGETRILTRLAADGSIRWQEPIAAQWEGEAIAVDADRALVGLTDWEPVRGAAPLLVDRQGHARELPLSTEMYWSFGIAAHPSGRAVITGQIACAGNENDPLCRDPPPPWSAGEASPGNVAGHHGVVAMIELP